MSNAMAWNVLVVRHGLETLPFIFSVFIHPLKKINYWIFEKLFV